MSETLDEMTIQRTIVTELKTVAELLLELGISADHVVVMDGKRVLLTFELQENDNVAVLPLITST